MSLNNISIKALFLLFFVSLTFFFNKSTSFLLSSPSHKPTPTDAIKKTSETAKVKRVIDGDTIELENGKKVRYIGINAPEIYYPNGPNECFALQAREANETLVGGKTVRLEKDISETDKYGRLLRYVYLEDPWSNTTVFVNKFLISEGYSRLMTVPPDLKYYPDFKIEQLNAQNTDKGLWSVCQDD